MSNVRNLDLFGTFGMFEFHKIYRIYIFCLDTVFCIILSDYGFTVDLCVHFYLVCISVLTSRPFVFLPLSTYISSTIHSRSPRRSPAMLSTHSTASCRAYPTTSTLSSSPYTRCWPTFHSAPNILMSGLRINNMSNNCITTQAAYFIIQLSYLNSVISGCLCSCTSKNNLQKVNYEHDVKAV